MAKKANSADETPDEKELTPAQKERLELDSKQIDDFVDGINVEEDNPIEKKAEEIKDVKEEVVEDKEEKPELDIEAIKSDISKELTDKIVKNLTGKTTEDITKETEEKPIWEKEDRNPTYKELADYTAEHAEKRVLDTLSKKEADAQAKRDELDNKNKETNEYWDSQMGDLHSKGFIPAIKDANNASDEGVKAEKEFYTQLYNHNVERMKNDQPVVTNLKEFYLDGYKKPRTEVAGADAPIAGGKSSGAAADSGEGYSYEDIKNTDIYTIAQGLKVK